jgi:hypothetical protein
MKLMSACVTSCLCHHGRHVIATVVTIVEEEQGPAAASSLLLHEHAVIEIASAWNDQRVVRRHALKLHQRN